MQKNGTLSEGDLSRENWPLVLIVAEWLRKRLEVVGYELGLKNKNGHLGREEELEPKGSREWKSSLLADRLTKQGFSSMTMIIRRDAILIKSALRVTDWIADPRA